MRQREKENGIRRDRRWPAAGLLGLLALAGVVTAALATYVHYQTVALEGGYRSFCTLSDAVDCTAVVLTPQSRLLGIPISILGAFTYLIVLGLQVKGFLKSDAEFERSLALTALIGFGCTAYSVYLGYIVIAVVQRHCLLCYALYGVNVSLLLFGLFFARRRRVRVVRMLAREVRSVLENRVVAIGSGALIVVCAAGAFAMRNAQRELLIQRNPMLSAIFDGSAQRLRLELHNVPALGPEDAAVTIIEFNDFQCPFCRQSAKTLKKIAPDYAAQMRREFLNLPLDRECNRQIAESLHPGSCVLAYAGRVAYLEGGFWEFHERAFSHVGQWDDAALISLLAELGVPEEEAAERLADAAVRVSVENDIGIAHHLGIERTPSFMINGMLLEGHFDPWLWERIIDLEIARAEARRLRSAKQESGARDAPEAAGVLPATGLH